METTKRRVCWLESFPADIWAYIVWYISGEQLGRLMMTGATFLWKRLKSSGVVKSINLGKDFILFKSWPLFLNSFPSLEELSIHSHGLEWSNELGLVIDLIPSGVRKLQLSGLSWSGGAQKLFGKIHLSKCLPQLDTLDLPAWQASDYLTHCPPTLTKLRLSSWNGTVELPSSLVHFEARDVDLRSIVSRLPPTLESFVVTDDFCGVELLVPLLPLSTRKLLLGVWPQFSNGQMAQLSLLQLPKSLTWFEVAPDYGEFSESAQFLPSTLTELSIQRKFPCSAWPLLPPNLTKLDADYMTVDPASINGVIPFDSLPRSITSLQLCSEAGVEYFCIPPKTSNRSFFPPQLVWLKIQDISLSPETAKLLPSSLTYLKFGNLCERVCEHLPSGLKTLICFQTLMSPVLFKFLPKCLTFLLLYPQSRKFLFDYNTGSRIAVSELPDFSIHQNCMSSSFDWKDSSRLPPSITYLHLSEMTQLSDSFMPQQSLPNLLELNLDCSKHLSDLCIPLLSRNLTTLELGSASMITGKSFEFLPRCLTHLDLRSSQSIFDSDIQHLPRTLKHAYLDHAKHLTNLCVPDLPRHLELLHLNFNAEITPLCVPHLPYPLRSCQLEKSAHFAMWKIDRGVVSRTIGR